MRYTVKIPFKALCCGNFMQMGDKLEILKQTSKNRLTIKGVYPNGCHNVKRSTFMRCCEELKETNEPIHHHSV